VLLCDHAGRHRQGQGGSSRGEHGGLELHMGPVTNLKTIEVVGLAACAARCWPACLRLVLPLQHLARVLLVVLLIKLYGPHVLADHRTWQGQEGSRNRDCGVARVAFRMDVPYECASRRCTLLAAAGLLWCTCLWLALCAWCCVMFWQAQAGVRQQQPRPAA
jgi:hypothetical protein